MAFKPQSDCSADVLVSSPATAGQADVAAALSFQDQHLACSQAGMLQSIPMAAAATGPACVRFAVSQQLLQNLQVRLCYVSAKRTCSRQQLPMAQSAMCDVHAQIAPRHECGLLKFLIQSQLPPFLSTAFLNLH